MPGRGKKTASKFTTEGASTEGCDAGRTHSALRVCFASSDTGRVARRIPWYPTRTSVAGTGGGSFLSRLASTSRLLGMNKRRVWCRTSGARRLPMDPALPGWADFWCRPSGPGRKHPLSLVHSFLNLPQASRLLTRLAGASGMTKCRVVAQVRAESGIATYLPRGMARQLH